MPPSPEEDENSITIEPSRPRKSGTGRSEAYLKREAYSNAVSYCRGRWHHIRDWQQGRTWITQDHKIFLFTDTVKMPIPRSVMEKADENEAILISTNASGIRNEKTIKAAWNKLAEG